MSAHFIIPDFCICFIQFSFDVFVLVGFVYLFGINKFNVHGSVHRKNIPICIQQDATLHLVGYTGLVKIMLTRKL